MLGWTLDASYPAPIRRDITTVTAARIAVNALFRYVGPFLAVVADGLDVSVGELGVALTVSQASGFASPVIGRLVDCFPRRRAIALGLAGAALGGLLAAVSTGIVWFTVALLTISAFNIVLVVGTGAWITDHVPFTQRSRVVGLHETSWALGLLVGVSAMGLVTAATSWRWAYAAVALGVVGTLALTWVRLDRRDAPRRDTAVPSGPATLRRDPVPLPGWLAIATVVALTAASESLFVTFGVWLKDDFDVADGVLAAATFALGAVELGASALSMTRTDRWGKERSVLLGGAVMVVVAGSFLLATNSAVLGLALVALFIGAFEFSIVSLIPVGGDLVLGSPGRGLGLFLGAATLGRAITTIPTTQLYEWRGIGASTVLGATWAIVAVLAITLRRRLLPSAYPR